MRTGVLRMNKMFLQKTSNYGLFRGENSISFQGGLLLWTFVGVLNWGKKLVLTRLDFGVDLCWSSAISKVILIK